MRHYYKCLFCCTNHNKFLHYHFDFLDYLSHWCFSFFGFTFFNIYNNDLFNNRNIYNLGHFNDFLNNFLDYILNLNNFLNYLLDWDNPINMGYSFSRDHENKKIQKDIIVKDLINKKICKLQLSKQINI